MKKILAAACCAMILTTSAVSWAGPHGGHHRSHHAPVRVVHHHGGHHYRGANLFWGALAGVAVGTIVDGVIQSYRPYQRVTYATQTVPTQNCVTVTNQNTGITTTQCTTM